MADTMAPTVEIVTEHELGIWLTSAMAAFEKFEALDYSEVAAIIWVGLTNHLIGQRAAKRLKFKLQPVQLCPLGDVGLMLDEWRELEGKEFIASEQANLAAYLARAINGTLSGRVTRA